LIKKARPKENDVGKRGKKPGGGKGIRKGGACDRTESEVFPQGVGKNTKGAYSLVRGEKAKTNRTKKKRLTGYHNAPPSKATEKKRLKKLGTT